MIPEFTSETTYRDLLDPAMDIATRRDLDEAAEYVRQYTIHLMRDHSADEERATHVIRTNLGYYAGYYDRETQDAVYEVFGAPHPFFGTQTPTAEQAFNIGQLVGETIKAERSAS